MDGEGHDGSPEAAEAWLTASGFALRGRRELAGDVSSRRYSRIRLGSGETAILATYPPETGDACSRFLTTTGILEGAGLHVPRILAADCARGFMLVEDVGGGEMLADLSSHPWPLLEPYFAAAALQAERISRLPLATTEGLNPPLDGPLLRRELAQTWDLFLVPRGLTGDAQLTDRLATALDRLCAALGDGAQVVCHRDFMARNLVPLSLPGEPPARLAVLDHQDLRVGPRWYDLASLLNDSLFPPDDAHERLLASALPADGGREQREPYHRAAAQRTLKAVGTYVSFSRRGSDRHLRLVRPTLARCLGHLSRLPESADLAAPLAHAWSPLLG